MPRMWLTRPDTLCDKHLLGEHHELHVFVGRITKGLGMQGYLDNGHCEPALILVRHEDIVQEMRSRNMNHKSPITRQQAVALYQFVNGLEPPQAGYVDILGSYRELMERCEYCAKRIKDAQLELLHGTP